ncbi:MAG: DciA family protein [Phycisphaerae bacterium]
MNESQYGRTVRNRRRYEPRPLFGATDTAGLLAATTRRAARCRAAATAWAEVTPPALRDAATVADFEGGVLELAVSSATAGHYLRQRLAGLRRQMAGLLPGLRRIRLVAGRHDASPAEGRQD